MRRQQSYLGVRHDAVLTFVTTLGNVPRWKLTLVFHSVPIGAFILRSNWALLV